MHRDREAGDDVDTEGNSMTATDEFEPVTEEWLRKIGAKRNRAGSLVIGPGQWWEFPAKSVFGIDHPNGFIEIPTRGRVRCFCKAIGFTPSEEKT